MVKDVNYYMKINGINSTTDKRELQKARMEQSYRADYSQNIITSFEIKINIPEETELVVINFEREITCLLYERRLKEAVLNSMAREIQCHIGEVNVGDYITHTDKQKSDDIRTYIVRSEIDRKRGYDSSFILRCQRVFKGISDDGLIYDYPVHFVDNKTMLMESSSQIMTIPADVQQCFIQENEHTKKINNGDRFISNGKVFEVVGIDEQTMSGLLSFRLKKTSFTSDDNKELEIADYYKTFPRDDNTPTEPTDPEVPIGSYSLTLSGSEEALCGFTEDYKVSVRLNGEDIGGKDIEWRISNADGTTASYATIESVNGYDCTIKAGSTKYIGKSVILRAELVANSTIFDEKTIRIVGF